MSGATVLKPDPYSLAWQDFCEELSRQIHTVPGACPGRFNRAPGLLDELGYDVEATLALFEQRGGYCDCEVLLNVDQPTLEDERDMFREMSR
jgi:hypothetical protein